MNIEFEKIIQFEVSNISDVYDLGVYMKENEVNYNEEVNISQMARQLNVSRDTIRRNLNGFQKKKSRNRSSKIDKYKEELQELLKNPKKKFKTKAAIYSYLTNEHGALEFSAAALRHYINKNLSDEYQSMTRKTNLSTRFETLPGEQAQFDFKESQTIESHKGDKIKYDVAVIQLSNSRKLYRKVIANKKTETVLAFLSEAFEHFGGVTKSIVVDNCKCLVTTPATEKEQAILNVKFSEFLKDFDMTCYVCAPYQPQTKGKVERTMTKLDDVQMYNAEISDVLELGNVITQMTNEYNETKHSATLFRPNFLFKQELSSLKNLPSDSIVDGYKLKLDKGVKVDHANTIKYKNCFYSVPTRLIGKRIFRQVIDNVLNIYFEGHWVTSHVITGSLVNKHSMHDKVSGQRSNFLNNTSKESGSVAAIIADTRGIVPAKKNIIEEQVQKNLKKLGAI